MIHSYPSRVLVYSNIELLTELSQYVRVYELTIVIANINGRLSTVRVDDLSVHIALLKSGNWRSDITRYNI